MIYRLTPIASDARLRDVTAELRDEVAWFAFRADWIRRTGRIPAADFRDRHGRYGLPNSLTRADLTLLRPATHEAHARNAVRALRCCGAAYWCYALLPDPVQWNAACRLLELGWAHSDADLIQVVNAITGDA
jgi:hypothetical protein